MDIYGYMRRRSATRVERKPGIGGVCASRALLRTRRLRHASALVAILADESPVSCASVSTALYSASRNVLSRFDQRVERLDEPHCRGRQAGAACQSDTAPSSATSHGLIVTEKSVSKRTSSRVSSPTA